MTNREICERLMSIHNSVMFVSKGSGVIGENPCYCVSNAIRELILDLAAPDDHFADLGKKVEKSALEPPVLIYEERGEKTPCPACGALAYIIKNAPKIYCKRCAKFYTREEDAK